MDIRYFREKNLSYIVVDNFYTAKELAEIKIETEQIRRFAVGARKTNTAFDENGKLKKTGTGLFVDELYVNKRERSAILTYNRKIFSKEFMDHVEQFDIVFRFIRESNTDSTLLNYYEEGQEYKSHMDSCRISAVSFLVEGSLVGGDFIFPEQSVSIPCINNRMVIFPSCTEHQAKPVLENGVRISIAQFIDHVQKI
jgi:Rps23 Pro-64 3,4-dihydroxylase Tpa1-like proline 4-hydroxylase